MVYFLPLAEADSYRAGKARVRGGAGECCGNCCGHISRRGHTSDADSELLVRVLQSANGLTIYLTRRHGGVSSRSR